jgi:hypothetical protein
MADLSPEIVAFYEEGTEATRLLRGLGRLEFARMRELLSRHFPPSPAIVADIGGGPGVYACWLAAHGHVVHLVDPIRLHVEQARDASARQPHDRSRCVKSGTLAICRLIRRASMPSCSTGRSIT